MLYKTGFVEDARFLVDTTVGDSVVEQSKSGDAVIAKLDAIVIPIVDFKDASVEEAIDFLRQRSIELKPERQPTQLGVSFIVLQTRSMKNSAQDGSLAPNTHRSSPDYTVNYAARDVPLLDVLSEVARQGHLDAYLTSVGIILAPEGMPPFPNPKATEGQVWKVLRKAESTKDEG
jgi:hypothetical protein